MHEDRSRGDRDRSLARAVAGAVGRSAAAHYSPERRAGTRAGLRVDGVILTVSSPDLVARLLDSKLQGLALLVVSPRQFVGSLETRLERDRLDRFEDLRRDGLIQAHAGH